MCAGRSGFFTASTIALLLFLAGPVAGQSTITGRVVDQLTGQPVNLADVTGGGRSVSTNAQGTFTLSVPPGRHTISVSVIGYQDGVEVVNVAAGASVTVEIVLLPTALRLNPITVTASRQQSERTLSAPSAVNVVTADAIEVLAPTSPADYVKAMPGVDVIQTGINQSNTVARGFNNVFSGALLVLTDNRYARVPSLRLNAYNMIPATPLDIERVEVVLGPASALYGPNSANGVMHIITTSPIDKPGTSVSVAGGGRSVLNGAFRQAFRFNEKVGLKVSGQYFRGDDFEFVDEEEVRQAAANPGNDMIGARIFDSEKWSGEARLDVRPWDEAEDGLTFTYGRNMLVNSIELTGIGAGQARDWKYEFGQVQVQRSGFFWQAFMNRSDAGDSYLLRTGNRLVDKSKVLASQAQYAFDPTESVSLVAGVDISKTTPQTEGTINGSNEDSDETLEIGGYLSATVALSDQLDLVGALRLDDHEHLPDAVWSPRLGFVYEPVEGQVFRATFNRAFSTPTSNNLFLDLTAGTIPLGGGLNYRIQTTGVPSAGYTWTNQCAGGIMSYCMYSPFAPGTQLPAAGDPLWDGVLVPLALTDPTLQATLPMLGLTPAQFAAIVAMPAPGDLSSTLLRFNPEDPVNAPFVPDPGLSPVNAIMPTITNTFELGYQGLIAERVKLSGSVYRNQIRDFVGPLRVETPSVFLDGTSVATFVATRLAGAGVPLATAQAIGAGLAANAARVPLGTVAPDQRASSDLVLTYRNFGDVNLWGGDIGFEAFATDDLAILGSYSWVSKECFFNAGGSCSSTNAIALNAPTNKGSIGLRYDDRRSGVTVSGRMRVSDEFPMNSGVYVGTVHSYAVFDANAAYRVPGYDGFIVSATVNNIFNNEHQEFVGAPRMGRIALVKLQYAFGN